MSSVGISIPHKEHAAALAPFSPAPLPLPLPCPLLLSAVSAFHCEG
jgi:hypothetical protein